MAVAAADRAVARRAAARASRDCYDSDADLTDADDASSSGETLQLPKQGLAADRASSYDDKSLHLPRQGSIEADEVDVIRQSRVGLAL